MRCFCSPVMILFQNKTYCISHLNPIFCQIISSKPAAVSLISVFYIVLRKNHKFFFHTGAKYEFIYFCADLLIF